MVLTTVLISAEVCLCHQLGHPHKTFSVSSTASQSFERSSWPIKRPSLLTAVGWWGEFTNPRLSTSIYMHNHEYTRSLNMLDINRIQQDPTGSNRIQYPTRVLPMVFPWFSHRKWCHGPRVLRLQAMLNLLDEELDKVKRSPGGCGRI